jgi:hypothetical protein
MYIKKYVWLILMGFILTACAIPSFLLPADAREDSSEHEVQQVLPTSNLVSKAQPSKPTVVISSPTPAPKKLTATPGKNARLMPGEATVADATMNIFIGPPAEYSVDVSGTLPSECSQLKVDVGRPDGNGNIKIKVSSLLDPGKICDPAEVPFNANFILDKLKKGNYSVTVNDIEAGTFQVQ